MAVSAVKKERAKPADNADAPAAEAKPAGRSGKLKLMLALGVVLLAGAGGGAYWYMQHNNGSGKHEAKVEPATPPVFVPLDTFTVNLQLEETPQFLQIGLSLKVRDNAVVDALKLHMPEVRDRALLLLSSQKASTLLTLDGKKKLASEIVATVNSILEPGAPRPAPAAPAGDHAGTPQAEAAPGAEAEEKVAAEDGEKPAPVQAAKLPVLSVLFTSFIVQ
jgi:flagellar FliL protein